MVPSPAVADPEVPAKATRRRFTAAEKARILDAYEGASDIERAAICRRERLYSSLLSKWRKQRGSGRPLSARRGPKPDPQAVEATQSQKRIAELERKLAKAEQVIDIQGKVYALLRACAGESADGLDLPPWNKRSSTVSAVVGERQSCKQFGVSRASFQRHQVVASVESETALLDRDAIAIAVEDQQSKLSRQVRRYLARKATKTKPTRFCARALTLAQRQALLDAVHQERFIDRSVPYIYATLLDENLYYGSISTMYRVLRSVGEVGERRDQATRPAHVKPELCATAPNQVYAWEITKLHGFRKWTYFYLYAVIDIYSRYVIGSMIADRESSALAKLLLETTIREQGADPTKLTIHADRGSSMTSKPVTFMLADLGVTKSHSRPHVSNDNPHIESLFKTTKYQPQFPATFANIVEARAFCRAFYAWYNNEHRHSAIALLTPSDVHHGRVEEKTAQRQIAFDSRVRPQWSTDHSDPPLPHLGVTVFWLVRKPNYCKSAQSVKRLASLYSRHANSTGAAAAAGVG